MKSIKYNVVENRLTDPAFVGSESFDQLADAVEEVYSLSSNRNDGKSFHVEYGGKTLSQSMCRHLFSCLKKADEIRGEISDLEKLLVIPSPKDELELDKLYHLLDLTLAETGRAIYL